MEASVCKDFSFLLSAFICIKSEFINTLFEESRQSRRVRQKGFRFPT